LRNFHLEHEHVEADHLRDVVDALLAMGYTERSIRATLQLLDIEHQTTSEIIREALKILGK
jgi:Holliday junction resolvasome RuvABC DNA-binding subunit